MRIEAVTTDVHSDPRIEALQAKISQLEADCETLRWFVGHDELTGLPNRRMFSTLAPAHLRASTAAVVLLLDLNGFKPINDAYGHETGDRVLKVVAGRLRDRVSDGLIARLGGDEFVGVLAPTNSVHPLATWWMPKVTGLLNAIAAPMTIAGRQMSVTASIGVAVPDSSTAIGDLMHHADMAMYEAKIHGLGYQAWRPEPTPVVSPAAHMNTATHASPATHTNPTTHMNASAHMTPSAHETSRPTTRRRVATKTPVIDPYKRDPADITPAGTYQRADPVWVFRHGAWHPGVVESASRRAVMATYRRNAGAGTVVDTMGAECVLERADADPQLDEIHSMQVRPVA